MHFITLGCVEDTLSMSFSFWGFVQTLDTFFRRNSRFNEQM